MAVYQGPKGSGCFGGSWLIHGVVLGSGFWFFLGSTFFCFCPPVLMWCLLCGQKKGQGFHTVPIPFTYVLFGLFKGQAPLFCLLSFKDHAWFFLSLVSPSQNQSPSFFFGSFFFKLSPAPPEPSDASTRSKEKHEKRNYPRKQTSTFFFLRYWVNFGVVSGRWLET